MAANARYDDASITSIQVVETPVTNDQTSLNGIIREYNPWVRTIPNILLRQSRQRRFKYHLRTMSRPSLAQTTFKVSQTVLVGFRTKMEKLTPGQRFVTFDKHIQNQGDSNPRQPHMHYCQASTGKGWFDSRSFETRVCQKVKNTRISFPYLRIPESSKLCTLNFVLKTAFHKFLLSP